MTRQLSGFVLALTCACTLGLRADAKGQEKTKVDVEHGKALTYIGCVRSGEQAESYILANALPFTETETRGTAGTMTDTTYLLLPEKTITLHEHVGQKVQVTGALIEAGHGDAKIETRTKENGSEKKTKEEVKRGPLPQFRVISVKPLGERCE